MTRPLHVIARDIKTDMEAGNWTRQASYAAIPYLTAMSELETINDRYGCDSGKSIVLYFLSNALTWKGERAREIKLELRQLVGIKPPPVRGC